MRTDFHDHAVAHRDVGVAKQLEVGNEFARPYPEHETPPAHVIELRRLGRNHDRVVMGQANDAGTEVQIFGTRN